MLETTKLLQVSTVLSTVDTPVSQIRRDNNKLISNSKFFDLKNKSVNHNRISIKLDYNNSTFQSRSIFYDKKVIFFYLFSNYPVNLIYECFDFLNSVKYSHSIITSSFMFNNNIDYLVTMSMQGVDYKIYNPEFYTIYVDYAFIEL